MHHPIKKQLYEISPKIMTIVKLETTPLDFITLGISKFLLYKVKFYNNETSV